MYYTVNNYLECYYLPWPDITCMHCTAVLCVPKTPIAFCKDHSKTTPNNIFEVNLLVIYT